MIEIIVTCQEPARKLSFRIDMRENYKLEMKQSGQPFSSYITEGNNLDTTIGHIYPYVKEFMSHKQWFEIALNITSYINSRNETYFLIETQPSPRITTHE